MSRRMAVPREKGDAMKTYRDHLDRKLGDKEFSRVFQSEKRRLRIAYEIREARLKNGLTQKELAAKAGVTQQMLSRVENAATPNVTLNTISQICSALGMEVGLVPPAKTA